MLGAGVLAAVSLAASSSASQVGISQGYHVSGTVVEGTLVSMDSKIANTVTPATLDRADSLVGVVVRADESVFSLSSDTGQTQVATSGTANALVTDMNGPVKNGDRITVSSLQGVGMKTTVSAKILGIAQADLAAASDLQAVQVQTKDGSKTTVKVGHIPVLINISNYNVSSADSHSVVPQFLQSLSNSVAGKPVSTLRIIISSLLLLTAIIASIFLIYGAVKSSIISIGRNPLSQSAVRKGLLQVLGFVGIILLVTLISIYFILR